MKINTWHLENKVCKRCKQLLSGLCMRIVCVCVATHKWLRGGVVFIDDISASGKIVRRILKDRARHDKEAKVKAKL